MNTVTLGIASHDAMTQSFAAAMRGEEQGQFISFDTPELLFQTLTETRWNLLRVMIGAGPLSIRAVARRLDRDVERVHEDVTALLNCGVLERHESGSIVFPYDAMHVDFTLRTMAA
ncbi:HVO_A0114 family putative DNA-binding protein [Paraburkholderia caledonica]|uniref:HVO_A0114 family putative DNA-binding protein n=1 Tax=Paraburkholderia caledonica TaxID=134536 RepID=UPI000B3FC1F7|nr:transcriptional regulator [Paraburkholderia caledonica]AXF13525.1 transcriptional regulator [Paraburkholderia caledonica]